MVWNKNEELLACMENVVCCYGTWMNSSFTVKLGIKLSYNLGPNYKECPSFFFKSFFLNSIVWMNAMHNYVAGYTHTWAAGILILGLSP